MVPPPATAWEALAIDDVERLVVDVHRPGLQFALRSALLLHRRKLREREKKFTKKSFKGKR